VAQRLLDNARFIDFFLARSPRAQELIQYVVAENRLAKVELLDAEGRPISPVSNPRRERGWGAARAPDGPGSRRSPHVGARATDDDGPDDAATGGSEPTTPEGRRGAGARSCGGTVGRPRGDPTLLFPSLPRMPRSGVSGGKRLRRRHSRAELPASSPSMPMRGTSELPTRDRRPAPHRGSGAPGRGGGVALLDRTSPCWPARYSAVGRREADPPAVGLAGGHPG
jgi:hypothetical protein